MADLQPSPERWLPIVGHEGHYEVSDQGRVRSVDRVIVRSDGQRRRFRSRVLKPNLDHNGHLYVNLSRGAKPAKRRYVHRLVLETFSGAPIAGQECRHLDDDKSNNRLANLKWGSRSDNLFDAVANGRHYWAKRTHCSGGHEYAAGNVRIGPRGERHCKICEYRRKREWRQSRRERGLPVT